MRPLRIGVNALYLIPGGVGGTEIYLRNLLREMALLDTEDEFFIFTNRETGSELVPDQPNFRSAPQPVRAVNRPFRIAWEQTGLPAAALECRLDVLLNPGFTSPVVAPCPCVTVFHDLQHKRHPEYFRWFDLPFWRLCLWASAHRSRLLIASSEATRSDLVRYYRITPRKIRLVLLGVNPEFFEIARERACRASEPYFLCVSTLHPHKNLERLIRAFDAFRKRTPGFRLIIAGLRGFHAQAIEQLIADLGLVDQVLLPGWVATEELHRLYLRAFAFIYPSTFEGFGLPVLEAMAAGVPGACSSIEPLAGIAGEAALQFDPLDESAIRDALSRLATDPALRAVLSADGPARAAQFPWSRTAEGTLAVLREAARAT